MRPEAEVARFNAMYEEYVKILQLTKASYVLYEDCH